LQLPYGISMAQARDLLLPIALQDASVLSS